MKVFWLLVFLPILLGARKVRAAKMPWLHASGTQIVDSAGHPVLLRGVNLGGWLVEEMWMMPFVTHPPEGSEFPEIKDHASLWKTLKGRFGAKEAGRFRTAFRENWINEADFDRIQAAGFNCVRLPFLYDLLDEPHGFEWLDRAIRWAGKRRIYVILDMHGAPGRQSADHHTGEEGVNRLFSDPKYVEEGAAVWKRVAKRYKNRPEVAGYDLVNEPMGAPDGEALSRVQDRFYQAVRSVDSRHIVIFEDGYKGLDRIADPAAMGWKNVMMSIHIYLFSAKSTQDHLDSLARDVERMKPQQLQKGTPLYIGEFNIEPHSSPETMKGILDAYEKEGWSWSVWMYKMVRSGGDASMWGLYRNPNPIEPLDPYRDSIDELIRKSQQVRTERLEPYPGLLDMYKSRFAVP
jgi:hypothetical protein